ncbi:peroxidase family protein [Marinibactrum halimedae]|uniref:Peroxidase n=1 Tax=Marinibactrum halimedae TaxID=1444977 RepID=A0AA37WP94_9GAMM|nr:peroxidase family protein [Marinibactrum halimedae]MCD9459534.1 hypothetical protein [Marinibactrum halimedae]GLS28188.1 hypothetical protein GCM10007877_39070 [Marinibactrum halimedae]
MANSIWVTWPALTKFGTLGVLTGVLILAGEREDLLENNLIDVENLETLNASITCDERSHTARLEDGTCNQLDNPAEGSVYRRFGRNVALDAASGETEADTLLSPNPREVSNVLMSRGEFKPATSVNFIAAAWIQFMIHDWVSHGPNKQDNPIEVPLPAGDPLGTGVMEIERTTPDPQRSEEDANLPATYRNVNTHWWDGSQLYGSDASVTEKVREFSGGRLTVTEDNTLPTDFFSGVPITGFTDNWWLGLSMMHQLFTLEHNAIAEKLQALYPEKSDQWLYDKARLINSALMAKIHTVEWTPAIIANPVTERSLYANWWGLKGDRDGRDDIQEDFEKFINAIQNSDSWIIKFLLENNPDLADKLDSPGFVEFGLGGLVGARDSQNSGVPYTLTEEFVAVYRMHPLMRDNVEVYDIGSNIVANTIPIQDTRDGDAEDIMDDEGADRLWYSFGITNPGSLTLNNYPEFLRNLSLPLVGDIDLATIDVIRDRERGVPRYNEFRRQIGLTPIREFEDLTQDPTTLANLKRIYDNDVEKIDALVGQLAETVRPEGFAFGETAFQIFILNASRRLMTDRFYTKDYTPEVYTAEGIDWVEETTMVDVIERHFPQLAASLVGQENAFKPWGLNMPEEYESWSACTKQQHLWVNGAMRTQYDADALPALKEIDVLGLIDRILREKVKDKKDVAPAGYEKPIHARAAMAKVAFNATEDSPYTGIFEGSDCGFLRLSVTGDPADRGFAPGLAWKTFIDGQPSANVSALYTLSGQGDDYDIFANELSQYVLPEVNETLGTTTIFSLVTTRPTRLMTENLAQVNQQGTEATEMTAPTQIYFVPSEEVKHRFETAAHDFREDLLTLPEGTKVYDVYGTSMAIKTSLIPRKSRRFAEERREDAVKIGELVLTSPFISSAFSDEGIFFKHQRYEDAR